MSKGKKIGGIILIVIGTIFLVIGIAIGGLFFAVGGATDEAKDQLNEEMDSFTETAWETYGEITDIDDESMATIEYYSDADGYWYETGMGILSEEYGIGDTVTVYYNPEDPTEVMIPELYGDAMDTVGDMMPVVGGVFGGIFGVIGLIMLIIGIVLIVNNRKDKKWVEEINTRNAQQMVGQPYSGNPQGQQSYNGYPQGAGQQPNSAGNPQNPGQSYSNNRQ